MYPPFNKKSNTMTLLPSGQFGPIFVSKRTLFSCTQTARTTELSSHPGVSHGKRRKSQILGGFDDGLGVAVQKKLAGLVERSKNPWRDVFSSQVVIESGGIFLDFFGGGMIVDVYVFVTCNLFTSLFSHIVILKSTAYSTKSRFHREPEEFTGGMTGVWQLLRIACAFWGAKYILQFWR